MSNDPSAVSELPDKDSLDNGISNDNERAMGGNGDGGDGLRLPRTTGTLNVNALQKALMLPMKLVDTNPWILRRTRRQPMMMTIMSFH